MRKIKALLALILAVSMLLGSSEITALAETLAGDVLDTVLLEEETYETTGEEITDVSSSEEALTPYEETGESEAEEVEEIEEVDESEEDFVQVQNDAEFSFAYTVLDAGAKKARLDGLSEGQTASGDLIIPGTIDGYTIVEIGEGAFDEVDGFTGTLSIPDTVTTIDDYAFYGTGFTGKVVIPESVTSIGKEVFKWCDGITEIENKGSAALEISWVDAGLLVWKSETTGYLTNIVQPGDTVSKYTSGELLGQYDYSEDLKLNYAVTGATTISITRYEGLLGEGEDLIIPSAISEYTVTEIASGAFDCDYANHENDFTGGLSIPNTVTKIGGWAFCCCGFTGSLVLPENLEIIGHAAFDYCCGLTGSLVIPDSVTAIGENAFYNCGFTGEVIIPSGVIEIGEGILGSCHGITRIVNNSVVEFDAPKCDGGWISESTGERATVVAAGGIVTKLAAQEYIYSDTLKIKYVEYTSTVSITGYEGKLGEGEDLVIPTTISGKNVTEIGSSAFSCSKSDDYNNFTGNLELPDNLVLIGINAFERCAFTGNLQLPEGLESIGNYAFSRCGGFTGDLVLPDGLKSVGVCAFYYCEFKYIENESHVSLDVPPTISGSHKWYDAVTGEVITVIASGSIAIRDDFDGVLYELKTEVLAGDPTAVKIVGYDGVISGDINIPATIDGYTVREIAAQAFKGAIGIKSVTLPEGILTIGDEAFSGCTGIIGDFVIPSTVTSIGADVISGCTGLMRVINNSTEEITLPVITGHTWQDAGDSSAITVLAAGKTAERDDYAVTRLFNYSVIDETGRKAGITGLKEGRLPSGALVIPSVIDGYTVTEIGNYAFNGCAGFTGSLVIPDSVTTIGIYAFNNCTGFTGSLVIPDSVTTIGNNAFNNCAGFTGALAIPDSVKNIGIYAFCNCENFDSLTLGSSLETIEQGAFYFCTGLSGDLVIPDSVTTIGNCAFDNCTGFTGSLVIPDSVTTIGDYAFNECSGFDGTLTLGNGLTSIGIQAFNDCTGFTGSLIIPDSVKTIGSAAFYGDNFDGELTLGSGLTSIVEYAFGRCTGFTGLLIIPDSVTTIGDYAFNDCPGFSGALVIPDSVKNIGRYAFSGCGNFDSLTLGSSLETIEEYAFYMCIGLGGDLVIPDSVKTIGKSAFSYSGFNGTLTIGNSVETIGSGAFNECASLTSLSLGSGLKSIGECAFYSCTGLSGELIIPEGVETVGEYAFYECTGFTGGLVIPESVTTIGAGAFRKCTGLDGSLTLNDGLEYIGQYAFSECSGLNGDIFIPDTVTYLGGEAFSYCSGFTGTVVIPKTVTEIDDYVFFNCFGLDKFDNKCDVEVMLPSDGEHYWILAGTTTCISVLPAGKTALRNDYIGEDLARYGFEFEEEYFYTGNAIKPAVVVFCGEDPLISGTDYTVSYKNNTKAYTISEGEAGFKSSKAPSVTITLKGNYSGKKVMYFTIKPKNIADGDVYVEDIPLAVEGSKAFKPAPVIHGVEKKLKNKSDYTYAYYSDAECTTSVTPKYAGIYWIKITGKGGYTGTVIKEFEIRSPEYKLVSKLKVDKIPDQDYRDGSRIMPEVVVKDGKTVLVKDTDYTLQYGSNTDIGTGTVTITGTGTKYLGTQKVTFKIVGKAMSKVKVSGAPLTASYIYDGEAHKLNLSEITAVYKANSKASPEPMIIKDSTEYWDMSYEDKKGVDAYVTYRDNNIAGKATMILNGVNEYSGTLKKTFKIKNFDLKTNRGNAVTVEFDREYYTYHKDGAKPVPVVKINGHVVDSNMYKVSYVNNTVLYGGSKHSSVKITGKKNFVNSISKEFKIIAGDLGDTESITVTAPVKVYADKAGNWKNTVTVKDRGKALKAGTDYSKNIVYTYKDIPEGFDVKDGSVKSKPVVERNIGDVVGDKDIVPAGTIIQAEITCDTNGKYVGTTYGEWKIIGKDIGKLKATIKSRTFTGSEITLGADDITFKGKAPGEVTYEIVSYSNNINKGKASVVIRGTGNYGGTLKVTFNITSKGFTWWMFR